MGRDERSNPINHVRRGAGLASTAAYDRFGRQIQAGDAIHILGKFDIIWRVVHVKPILDPQVPPGTVEIALQAVMVSGVQGGALLGDILKVRDKRDFETQPPTDPPAAPAEPSATPPEVQ